MSNTLLKDYEIVVAHYSEDLEWLKPYADHAIIYHKWKEDKPKFPVKKWIKLGNIWREWHTFMYHIVNNYENLPEYTLFFQWWIQDHKDTWDVYENIESYISEVEKYEFSCSSILFMVRKNPQIKHWWKRKEMLKNWSMQKAKYPFNIFYKKIFKKSQPILLPFFYAANFWVSKSKIQSHPIEFYKNILSLMPEHSNPEEWHYYERLWFAFFNDGISLHFFNKFFPTFIRLSWNRIKRIFKK